MTPQPSRAAVVRSPEKPFTGEAVQLRHDQRARLASREHREGLTHSRPFEGAPGLRRVFLPLNLPPPPLGLCRDRSALSVDAVLLVCGGHAQVADNSHAALPSFMPLIPHQHIISAGGASSADVAMKAFRAGLEKLPPVKIVSLNVFAVQHEIGKGFPSMTSYEFVAVVEEV